MKDEWWRLLSILENGREYLYYAERMHCAVSTVSKMVKQIETEYDIKLFSDKKKETISREGLELKAFADRYIQDQRLLRKKIDIIKSRKSDYMMLAIATPLQVYDITETISLYQKQNVGKKVSFDILDSDAILQAIRNDGTYDAGLIIADEFLDHDLQYHLVSSEYLYAVSCTDLSRTALDELSELRYYTNKAMVNKINSWWNASYDNNRKQQFIGYNQSLLTNLIRFRGTFSLVFAENDSFVKDTGLYSIKLTYPDNSTIARNIYFVYKDKDGSKELMMELFRDTGFKNNLIFQNGK